jgi:hypothetical protein
MQTIGIITVFVAGYFTGVWTWQYVRPLFVWAIGKISGAPK